MKKILKRLMTRRKRKRIRERLALKHAKYEHATVMPQEVDYDKYD